jgi:hypothetical protein
MSIYVMIYKAVSHVTLSRMRELSPAPIINEGYFSKSPRKNKMLKIVTEYYLDDQIKEYDISETYSAPDMYTRNASKFAAGTREHEITYEMWA